MAVTNQRIFVKSKSEEWIKDGIASEDITPGHLVEGGGSDDIQKQSTSGENAERAVAMVDRNQHGLVSDDWPSGDSLDYGIAQPGEELYVRLGFGGAEHNISKWEFLEAGGDGTVQSAGTGSAPNQRLFVALEALDNSGGSSESLIKVRAM